MILRGGSSVRITRLVSFTVVSIAWWALLGWDSSYYEGADGQLHGPYSTGQVTAFVIVLLALAVWIGVRHDVLGSSVVASGAAAVNFGVTATVITPDDTGLWMVGAVMLAGGVVIGGLALGSISEAASRLIRRASA